MYNIKKMSNKIWILAGIAAAILVLTILYFLYAIFAFIASFITAYGAFTVYLIAIISVVRYIIRSLVFPGSNIFIRKAVEYNIRENMTRIILNTVGNLKYTLEETCTNEKLDDNNAIDLKESISDIRKMIETIVSNNERQRNLKTLSSDQEEFQQKLEAVKKDISSVRLLKQGKTMTNVSIWDAEESSLENLIGCSYSDNLRTKIGTLDSF